jgi:hypothetical protein
MAPMTSTLRVASITVAVLLSTTMAYLHYDEMQPMAGNAFSFNGVSPQDRVAQEHLSRAVPVAFGVMLPVAVTSGLWLARTRRLSPSWIAVGGVAGILGFAAATPFVPDTSVPFNRPHWLMATVEKIPYEAFFGGLYGVLVGAVASIVWFGIKCMAACVAAGPVRESTRGNEH